jgi:hypothetical protein
MRELNLCETSAVAGGHPVLFLAAHIIGRAGAFAGTAAVAYWTFKE